MSQFTLLTGDIVSYDSNQVTKINAAGDIIINRFAEPLFIPDSAKAALELGRLDDNLFNLNKLMRSGYADPCPTTRVLIETTKPLPEIKGLLIKRRFNIIDFCSAEIEKSHSKSVLDALLKLEYVQQIQLDEVMQLQPPSMQKPQI
ncbi:MULTISPECIES: hypothetical protein [unclassified Pseudoalteromonas]|jgi:hypothetical protein|uniref:hypothetical protein n=1 Tax=Pseudoalteromonas TaxID=53246 RepID=UPI001020D6B5|nr:MULTISPECIES: hypothetical protein [unclassified Pseudoalteromonas]MCP4585816.1 hypothetical protein [Pseudoalteromonas sp.]QWV03952.1 hypothetical protein KQ246_10390 [Pseudoalteromonas shioyasakiensis]RZD22021.1 hypothetical protein EVU92_08080 [Pseudoalteromonas sp. MEBiC 03485]URQ89616.1 hypothetical protein J8Z25_12700 [Pseudoalteromonas sp. SCSIO 43101]